VADWPAYSVDVDICRLLASGPLPTAAIADRLGMPTRSARHRLRQLRRAGAIVTDIDGLHRLAAPVLPDLAAVAEPDPRTVVDLAAPDHLAGDDRADPDRLTPAESVSPSFAAATDPGWQSAIAAVVIVAVSLAALAVIGLMLATRTVPEPRVERPADPWWGVAW
jgi:Helix-turn-helix domain